MDRNVNVRNDGRSGNQKAGNWKKKAGNNKSNRISACLVVYNEGKLIERCLKNIKDCVDEIILVHDGACSDDTLETARKYGARIFIRKHIGEAEPHRNFSFQKAKYNWILQIDADEYFSEELRNDIRKLIDDDSVGAYAFKWDFYCYKDRHIYDYKMALFRKEKILPFQGIPHESVRIDGVVKKSDLELVHRPPMLYQTWKFFLKKSKWTKIQAKYLVDKDIPKLFYPIYFFKAIVWFFAYFIYTFIKYFNIRISLFTAIYNYLVWWHVFLYKLKKTHKIQQEK
jgi:glycosyltransferase involved in cell wall biosynthesis